MKLVSTPRIEFMRVLATEILHNYGRGRSLVAVDGADRVQREAFADDLAAVFQEQDHPVFRASLRYFQRPRIEQERSGGTPAERAYRQRDDYSALRRVLIDPFRMGGSTGFVTRQFDTDRDGWIQPTWTTAPPDATLIIDGDVLNRTELHSLWSYTVLLESDAHTDTADPLDALYRAEVNPRNLVDAVVDTTDSENLRRRFFDSC
jgi:uridine kinase